MLLRILGVRRHGATIKDLVHEFGVTEKTIRRDILMLKTIGFPVCESRSGSTTKTYRLAPDKLQPNLSFAFDEAIALYLGRRFLEPLAGTVFWDAAQRAFGKIRAALGDGAIAYVDQFSALFHQTTVGASDYSQKAKLIDALMQAIEECRVTSITYRSLQATEPVTYPISPLGLTYHRGSLYLVGQKVDLPDAAGVSPEPTQPALSSQASTRKGRPNPRRGQRAGGAGGAGGASGASGASEPSADRIRLWKVDRIEAVSLKDARFTRPAGFRLSDHFAGSFGVFQGDGHGGVHVKVRFSATVARYVQESQWHGSQRLTAERDGSVLAEFDLDSTEEIMRWLLSFGRHAEVLEPEELRQDIASEIESLSTIYERPSPNTKKMAIGKGT